MSVVLRIEFPSYGVGDQRFVYSTARIISPNRVPIRTSSLPSQNMYQSYPDQSRGQ
jgi:hypothetical protein